MSTEPEKEPAMESTIPLDLFYGEKFMYNGSYEMRASDVVQLLINHHPKEFERLLEIALRKEKK